MNNLLQTFEKQQIDKLTAKKRIPAFRPGDTIKVTVKIVEGEKSRLQAYEGVCISRKNNSVNSKFTVLGEVRNPGTFSYYDRNLNIFQALGYAGDITITGKRKNITLIREENGMRKVYDISLSKSELLNKPYYLIKNNDVIMVKPNFSKVKSAGFIGSPASIASVASLLLSVTLLILNK